MPLPPKRILAHAELAKLLNATQTGLTKLSPPAGLPVQERVADRLADALLALDEVIIMLREDGASHVRAIEQDVQSLFDGVDRLMRGLGD